MTWMLAVFSCFSCVLAGHWAARRVMLRLNAAQAWDDALRRMENAVETGATVTEALRSGRTPFLDRAAEALRLSPAQTTDAWLAALPWEEMLTARERDVLSACLRGLFAASREEQRRALDHGLLLWQDTLRACRDKKEACGGLYRRLGWLSGAALFILMC